MGQKGGLMLDNQNYCSSSTIFAKVTYYPHKVRVFIPTIPFSRSKDSSSSITIDDLNDDCENKNELNLERSLRRTKKRISDYILCNRFELFVTFTFAENRQDVNEKRRQMSDWLKNQRNRNGKFDYLIVPEFHKDKQSLHFHALFYGYCGSIAKSINLNTGKIVTQKGQPVYTLPEYTLGFSNAKRIILSDDSSSRLSHYVKKYITKDMPIFFNKQRYWASKGLKLPKIQYNPEPWFTCFKPDWEMENDFGRIMEFNIGNNPIIDGYWSRHNG